MEKWENGKMSVRINEEVNVRREEKEMKDG